MSTNPARFPLLDVNIQPVWWLSSFDLDVDSTPDVYILENRPFLLTNRGRL